MNKKACSYKASDANSMALHVKDEEMKIGGIEANNKKTNRTMYTNDSVEIPSHWKRTLSTNGRSFYEDA